MEKYFKILEEIEKNNLDITKLYILSCLNLKDKELAIRQMNYIYDLWIDTDVDLDLSRLADIVVENWEDIQNDKMLDDEIVEICLNY